MSASACARALACIVVASIPVGAGADEWSVVPLKVGHDYGRATILQIATCREEPARLLAVSSTDHLYRTVDSGDQWELVLPFVDGEPASIPAKTLCFAATGTTEAWATWGRSIFLTTDFGTNWSTWSSGLPGDEISVWFPDAQDPSRGTALMSGAAGGVFRTSDFGATWSSLSSSITAHVWSLAVSPADSDRLLAGTVLGIHLSTDSGASWELVRAGDKAENLQFDDTGSVALGFQQELVRSTDEGMSWAPVAAAPEDLGERSVLDPANPANIVMTDTKITGFYIGGGIAYGFEGRMHGTTSGGQSWHTSRARAAWVGDGNQTRALAVREGTAWMAFDAALESRSAVTRMPVAGGPSASITRGMSEYPVHRLDVDGSGALYAWTNAYFDASLSVSTDGGDTWLRSRGGAPMSVGNLEVDRSSPGAVLVSGNYGVDVSWNAVELSTDYGYTWREHDFGDQTWASIMAVYRGGASADTYYCWAYRWYSDGPADLYRSDDDLETLKLIREDLPRPVAQRVVPGSDMTSFVAVNDGPPVRRSTDGGVSWESRSRGLPRETVLDLLLNPDRGDHLLLVYRSGSPWESRDSGRSWRPLGHPAEGRASEAVLPEGADLRAVRIHAADWEVHNDESRVFLNTERGVWISDRGFVPSPRHRLSDRWLGAIAYSPTEGRLYAGRIGLYSRPLSPLSASSLEEPKTVVESASIGIQNLRVQPNPFRDALTIEFAPTAGTPTTLGVYDVTGRSVRTWTLTAGATTRTWTWDGRDSAGRPVSPGVYFVRLHSGDAVRSERVVRLR